MTSWSVQPFLHSSQKRVLVLYNGPPLLPLKISLLHGDLDPILWFLGPTRVHIPTYIVIVSTVLAGFTIMTDHATLSVIWGCIYLVPWCSLIMRTFCQFFSKCYCYWKLLCNWHEHELQYELLSQMYSLGGKTGDFCKPRFLGLANAHVHFQV